MAMEEYRYPIGQLNLHLSHSLNFQQRVDTCKLIVEIGYLYKSIPISENLAAILVPDVPDSLSKAN